MTTTKETFHHLTAEMIGDEYGNTLMLTQEDGAGENIILIHPIQLRHFAQRFAGMEPVGWMASQPVKTLVRRLRTLAFHIDFLYDYVKNHSDHRHADLKFELVKVTALSEMADEFCADLPDEDEGNDQMVSEVPIQSVTRKEQPKPGQVDLI